MFDKKSPLESEIFKWLEKLMHAAILEWMDYRTLESLPLLRMIILYNTLSTIILMDEYTSYNDVILNQ